jgi:hypothetical protein
MNLSYQQPIIRVPIRSTSTYFRPYHIPIVYQTNIYINQTPEKYIRSSFIPETHIPPKQYLKQNKQNSKVDELITRVKKMD